MKKSINIVLGVLIGSFTVMCAQSAFADLAFTFYNNKTVGITGSFKRLPGCQLDGTYTEDKVFDICSRESTTSMSYTMEVNDSNNNGCVNAQLVKHQIVNRYGVTQVIDQQTGCPQ